ncbi:sulfite exporter TauE/SafE family protein [Trichothermofontia sp.]
MEWLILTIAGLMAGIMAGLLGIGGGTVLVPILIALGHSTVEAVATSSLSIVITSLSGSIQNWRMGYLDIKRVLALGFPALATAQVGVWLVNLSKQFSPAILTAAFATFLLINIALVFWRNHIVAQQQRRLEAITQDTDDLPSTHVNIPAPVSKRVNPLLARVITGGFAGVLAGVFGIGGGIILVPLQMLLLGEPIKMAIQTSLGVIIITALSASVGHAVSGNILPIAGLLLGFGGLLGAQISTRLLPKLPDEIVSLLFRSFLGLMSIYLFWKAGQQW